MRRPFTYRTPCGVIVALVGRAYRPACPYCRSVPEGRSCKACGIVLPAVYGRPPAQERALAELIKDTSAAMGSACRTPEACSDEAANGLYLMGRFAPRP